jgi:hypothetical protein
MKRVLVLVEGLTEERFIKDVLAPHLEPRGVYVIPKIVTTKRVKQGPDFTGGITDYQKVENDLKRLLGDSGAALITTFIDYYGLLSEFPGMATRPIASPLERAQHVEAEWKTRIGHPRFLSYLMTHEFEALLFSKPEELSRALYQSDLGPKLKAIRDSFPTPEEIDDDPLTAPSKRILRLLPAYQKTVHGPLVTRRIGLETLRRDCRHFNDWLLKLESI